MADNEQKPIMRAKSIQEIKKENKMNKMIKEIRGKKTLTGFIIVLSALALIFLGYKLNRKMLVISVGDNTIGIVESKKSLNEYTTDLRKEISNEIDVLDVEFKEEIVIEKTKFDKTKISNYDKIHDGLKANLTYRIKAYTLKVNDKEVCTFENSKQLNRVLNKVRNNVYNDDKEFDFLNDKKAVSEYFYGAIAFGNKFVEKAELTGDDVLVKNLEEKQEQKTYKVKSGDSLTTIADKEGMTLEELLIANPGFIDTQVLRKGEAINLVLPMAKLPVISYQDVTYEAVVEPNIEKVIRDDQYEDYQSVIEPGKEGKKSITVRKKLVGETEISKEIIQEKVLEESEVRVIEVGAKKLPNHAMKGLFRKPTEYVLISEYFGGDRGSYYHKGIDFAGPTGTKIYASYVGTVIFAGYGTEGSGYNGYGYCVCIRHSSGYETLYGHLDSIADDIEVGTKVDSNTLIGYMGSTGDSSGSHLHFEIRKDGEKVNPAKYIYGIGYDDEE